MAGGLRRELVRGRWWVERVPTEHHVNGALKCYSRECFEAIGGIQERLGWDTIDETLARMRGFRTRTFEDLVAIHHRPWASADGTLRGRARYGAAAYIVHFPAYWVALRSLKLAATPDPRDSRAWPFFYGYVRAALRGGPRRSKTVSSGWRSAERPAVGLPASSLIPRRASARRDRLMCGIAGQVRAGGVPVEEDLIVADVRGPGASRAGLARPARVRARRSGYPTAPGHRPGDWRSADLQRGRLDRGRSSTERSTTTRELREELLEAGHTLTTHGDTEVIAHLYEEYGTDCVSRLNGMFCFALWDSRHDRLFLARDRVGKKPLFYSYRGGVLSFASELQALMQDPEITRDVDPEAIDAYLAYGYIPAPMSVFRGRPQACRPAHLLVYQEGALTIERYWRLDYSAKRRGRTTSRQLHEQIRASLRSAVARRLVADVPVGAFLSGGIDSVGGRRGDGRAVARAGEDVLDRLRR